MTWTLWRLLRLWVEYRRNVRNNNRAGLASVVFDDWFADKTGVAIHDAQAKAAEIERLKALLDMNANLNAKLIVDMGRVALENDGEKPCPACGMDGQRMAHEFQSAMGEMIRAEKALRAENAALKASVPREALDIVLLAAVSAVPRYPEPSAQERIATAWCVVSEWLSDNAPKPEIQDAH